MMISISLVAVTTAIKKHFHSIQRKSHLLQSLLRCSFCIRTKPNKESYDKVNNIICVFGAYFISSRPLK